MKMKNLILLASAFLASSAFAGGPAICHIEDRPIYCGGYHHVYVCGHRTVRVCEGGCAPEVQNGNIAAVQTTLTQLAQSKDFANATQFKAKVTEIAAETDSQVKFGAYMDLVGISNDPTSDDVMNFIGARTADPRAVASLQKTLDLSADQATQVVNAVTTAIKGNLQ
jgi:hypothetical protein